MQNEGKVESSVTLNTKIPKSYYLKSFSPLKINLQEDQKLILVN